MTQVLLLARGFIIQWVTLWLAPVEFTFDIIEAELERRGVDLRQSPYDKGPDMALSQLPGRDAPAPRTGSDRTRLCNQ
jgi:hypothetical protein